jgi:hypothetical protein
MHTRTQVRQSQADNDDVRGTDGRMLDMISHNNRVVRLPPPSESGEPEWIQVVEACFTNSAGALIDAGALLAGVSNAQIARYILSRLPEACPYRGVVFFDVNLRSWRIRARDGHEWSKSASPIPERACFALFDDLRCRRADLKLAHDTVAVVTVGGKMCKDKLMQAAGRMRRLAEGQKLVFAVSCDAAVQMIDMRRDMHRGVENGVQNSVPENFGGAAVDQNQFLSNSDDGVHDNSHGHSQAHEGNLLVQKREKEPCSSSSSTSETGNHKRPRTCAGTHASAEHHRDAAAVPDTQLDVTLLLQWVMRNTVQATMDGMITHAEKGMVYAASRDCRESARLDEVLELEDNYAEAMQSQSVCGIVHKLEAYYLQKRGSRPMCAQDTELVYSILDGSGATLTV